MFATYSRRALPLLSHGADAARPRAFPFTASRTFATRVNTGLVFVPEKEAWVVERMGRFHRILDSGPRLLIPILDRISYAHSLKVVTEEICEQVAITQDNVHINIDGVLYFKVTDAFQASYNIDNPLFAISQLALSTMRSEIGKMTLERVFEERTELNQRIVDSINDAASDWGVICFRYEIRDISPPEAIKEAMMYQFVAERKKREQVILSLAQQESDVNIAEGQKRVVILNSEAEKLKLINQMEGEAEAIRLQAEGSASAITALSGAIRDPNANRAMSFKVAEKYIEAFGKLAHSGTTMLLPSDAGNAASMVAQALSIFKRMNAEPAGDGPSGGPSPGPKEEVPKVVEEQSVNPPSEQQLSAPIERSDMEVEKQQQQDEEEEEEEEEYFFSDNKEAKKQLMLQRY